MARTRSRRPRRSAPSTNSIPDVTTLARWIFRPETVGALLVVLAAAALPSLLPFTRVVGEARDELVRAFGVHVFTLVLVVATLGILIALRRTGWIARRSRHLAGAALLIVLSAALLGRWFPASEVGSIDLSVHSAGGEAGRWLVQTLPGVTVSLLLLPAAFTLLWPRSASTIARAAPGAAWLALRRLHALGIHRGLWSALRAVARGLRGLAVTRHDPVAFEPIVARPDASQGASIALGAVIDELAEASPAEQPLALPALAPPEPEPDREPAQIPMDLDTPADQWRHSADGWQLPSIELLTETATAVSGGADNERRAQLIVDTLASFGVDSSVVQINEGPAVTQFGVEPGWDVKTRVIPERDAAGQPILGSDGQPKMKEIEVSRTRIRVNRITSLQNDLALALATPALRIEAPVPGKAMVGIEVPNVTTATVTLRDVMQSQAYQRQLKSGALPIALGASVSGEPVIADLATMPHLLIAGATGSGKSVCLNGIISCLLMNFSPEELRLVLIDPKRVELSAYADIPHLVFSEIVTEMDRVVGTLQAVTNEMESRYRRFAQAGVRNIKSYNERTEGRPLPYWVIVIDELADLMIVAPYQVETQLVRLAQLSRATGIHLVVATQRPSVDVITGLIKANFPTRIAFAVASHVDSRTVLDRGGAEKLLGRGDMLYVPPDSQNPRRIQGVFLSDGEIDDVVGFWTDDRFVELMPEKHDDLLREAERQVEEQGTEPGQTADGDERLAEAISLTREFTTMSTSMLQRKLRVGYPRAARMMDELEERGIIGPAEPGGNSRPVLSQDDEPEEAAPVEAAVAASSEPVTPRSRSTFPTPFDAE